MNWALVGTSFVMMALAQARISILATLVAIWYLMLCKHRNIALLTAGGAALFGVALATAIDPELRSSCHPFRSARGALDVQRQDRGMGVCASVRARAADLGIRVRSHPPTLADTPAAFGWNVEHADNLPIQGIIEVGLVGLGLLGLVLCLLAIEAPRLKRPTLAWSSSRSSCAA